MAGSTNGEESGARPGTSLADGEVPGVDDVGTPPPRRTATGRVDPEIPGITAAPTQAASSSASGRWQDHFDTALTLELAALEHAPNDNSAAVTRLKSLSAGSLHDLASLRDYAWVSVEARTEYRRATQLAGIA